MVAAAFYILSFLTSLLCALLLFRGYAAGKRKLLLWSGLCFSGLALSNLLVFVDRVLLPNVDLYLARLMVTATSMILLLIGLIWEAQ